MALWTTTVAPSVGQMDEIEGYEEVKVDSSLVSPPPSEVSSPAKPSRSVSFSNFPQLTEEEAKNSLLDFTSRRCCYGKSAARELTIERIEYSSTFHYMLETFGEKREFFWQFEPFFGQDVDSPWTETPPSPWQIPIPTPVPFKEAMASVEVPHTASIKPCVECSGNGNQRCPTCFAFGQMLCTNCNGLGFESNATCPICFGWGTRKCTECLGSGQIMCNRCDGSGKLKCYIQLTCYWRNHVDDCIVESQFMPRSVVKGVKSQIIFEEDLPRVFPIENFPDPIVNEVSAKLIDRHRVVQDTEKVLRQRHMLHVIPVARVHYEWKGSQDHFFVYGFENAVHAPNYPQRFCCGCLIF